jgi:hypothetical protein
MANETFLVAKYNRPFPRRRFPDYPCILAALLTLFSIACARDPRPRATPPTNTWHGSGMTGRHDKRRGRESRAFVEIALIPAATDQARVQQLEESAIRTFRRRLSRLGLPSGSSLR